MPGHPSIWVGETTDPLDATLHKTVADLKKPEKVTYHAPQKLEQPLRVAMHTKEYATTKTESFLSE